VILVAGATGTLGTRLAGRLTSRGEQVRILARKPVNASSRWGEGVEVVSGDVRDPGIVDRAVAGVRVVVSAVTGFGTARDVSPSTVDWQGNANLIRAARAVGVEHFVLLSVCQAAPDHPIELFRMKHRAEVELKGSGLAWTILRPTAYMETWLALVGVPLLQRERTRVFGRGQNPINFVSASDVARYAELAVTDPSMRGVCVDVGGPENLSMNDVVATFQRLTGAKGKVSHVPLSMMRTMSILMRPLNPALARIVAAAVVMDTRDMKLDPDRGMAQGPTIPPRSLVDVIRADYGQVRSTVELPRAQGKVRRAGYGREH
jgi:uncharacterized protein YbjT (DUF2867 family)